MQVISILDFTSCKTCHRRKKITRKVQASLAIVVQIHLTQTLHNSTVNKGNQPFSDETASKQSQVKTKILHNKIHYYNYTALKLQVVNNCEKKILSETLVRL